MILLYQEHWAQHDVWSPVTKKQKPTSSSFGIGLVHFK
jgi:hypothetical protein